MTNTEFLNEFDVLYNSITSNQAPGLDEYEKSVFLTKAQDEVVKSYFNPRSNKTQEGFDGNEKRQIDFSMITRSEVYYSVLAYIKTVPEEFLDNTIEIASDKAAGLVSKPNTFNIGDYSQLRYIPDYDKLEEQVRSGIYNKYNLEVVEQMGGSLGSTIKYAVLYTPFKESFFDLRDNTKSVTLNKDILMFINEYVEANRGDSTARLTVLPIKYTEYSRLMSKPYKRPLRNQAWRLLGSNDENKKAEFVIGPNDTITKYVIRYVRKPKAIRLVDFDPDDVTLDDDYHKQSCELDSILHPEILQRAVELAKAAYVGDLQSQIALGQASQTNIGAVQASR